MRGGRDGGLSRKANVSASQCQNLKFQHRGTPLKGQHCVFANPNIRTGTRPKNKAPFHTTSLPASEKIHSGSDGKWHEPHLNTIPDFFLFFFISLSFETGQLSICVQPQTV